MVTGEIENVLSLEVSVIKKNILALISLSISLNAFSSYEEKAYICLSDTIVQGIGGLEGFKQAVNIIEKMQQKEINGLAGFSSCEGIKKNTPFTRNIPFIITVEKFEALYTQQEFKSWYDSLSSKTIRFVERQILPESFCHYLELGLSIALGVAVSDSFSFGYCEDTRGNRWIEFNKLIGFGVGLGLTAVFELATNYPSSEFRSLGITYSDHRKIIAGLVGAFAVSDRDNFAPGWFAIPWLNSFSKYQIEESGGGGLGLGYTATEGKKLNLPLLVLPRSGKNLISLARDNKSFGVNTRGGIDYVRRSGNLRQK